MRVLTVVLGIPAAVVAAIITLFTLGEVQAIVVLIAWLVFTFAGAAAIPPGALPLVVLLQAAVLFGGGWFITDQAVTIIDALRTTSGPVDPADPALLASAESGLDSAADQAGFRIELHEDEITAVVQDGLADADAPLRKVTIDISDTGMPGIGRIDFIGEFKRGELTLKGSVETTIEAGAIQIEVVSVEVGALNLPGLAEEAVEDAVDDLLGSVADINQLLADNKADVQSIVVGNDRIVVTGTHPGGELVTSATLLEGIRRRAASAVSVSQPPQQRLGPGRVDGTSAEGNRYYLALGDSLAANVGVERARSGYVSRVHTALEERDGTTYGLRNLGVSGESSGSLLRGGQLDEAREFIAAHDVAYITLDVGANDLLGHLGSDDCSRDIEEPACRARISSAFRSYEANIGVILSELRDAAPDATIVFLSAYNPFSLGFGDEVAFERQSSETLAALNDLAAVAAAGNGVLVADGFTPMLGTAGVTTHMLDEPPDIHPKPIGYDVLASAVVEALP